MNLDDLIKFANNSKISAENQITKQGQYYYPFFDILTKKASFSIIKALRVEANGSGHTVVIAYKQDAKGADDYAFWCSDKFLEGRDTDQAAKSKVKEAVDALNIKSALITTKLTDNIGIFEASGTCDFWTRWRKSGNTEYCSHVSTALAYLRDNQPNFAADLKQAYQEAVLGGLKEVERGDSYTLNELVFKVPVLIEGDRGSGKTVAARAIAKEGGFAYVEAPGHEGIEAPDLLGFLVPISKNEVIWKDGPLSKAFRLAATQKVVLLLDELTRIRQRELSILLTALSPDDGVYRLATGRIVSVENGIGTEEVLECPIHNLAVIATANVGSGYAVDTVDMALVERFIILRKDTDVAQLTIILTTLIASKGFNPTWTGRLVEFFNKMTEAKMVGLVMENPSIRTLARAVALADSEVDIVRGIRAHILLWVARDTDGHPVQEQIDDCRKLIDRIFGS